MVADVAIHRNPGNPHAHVMLTMREMGPEGLSAKKNRDWNKPELLEQWRERWAVESNLALQRAGREERIDHRSLAEQGTERLPQVHLGPHAHALEKRGVTTEKGEHNRAVAEHNAVVIDLEKAREEKRDLEVRKVVTDRYNVRLRDGWYDHHAMALGQLEYWSGGGALTYSDAIRLQSETKDEHEKVTQAIQAIHQEGKRLEQAADLLADRQKAAADVERLKAPLATVKRWFSQDARKEFDRATSRLEGLEEGLKRVGTTSESELQEQMSRQRRDAAKIPKLEKQAEHLSRTLELVSKALDGLMREQEREFDWDLRRRRQRDRGIYRGR